MKKGIWMICLILLFSALGGCGEANPVRYLKEWDYVNAWDKKTGELIYYIDEGLPDEVRELVLDNRTLTFQAYDNVVEDEFLTYLTTGLDQERDEAVAAQILTEQEEKPLVLTRCQVGLELDFLFDYLKYGYAGYTYFGGDDVFLQLKEEIKEDTEEAGYPIAVEVYEGILLSAFLDTIEDAHFSVGNVCFSNRIGQRHFYLNEEQLFYKTGDGFVTERNGQEYWLVSIEGQAKESYLLPIVTEQGEMAYAVGQTSQKREGARLSAVLKRGSNGRLTTVELPLTRAAPTESEGEPYELQERNGIKIVRNSTLSKNEDLAQMVEDASALKDEPVLIIDLRENAGGITNWCNKWIYNYTEKIPSINLIMSQLNTATVRESTELNLDESREPGWDKLIVQKGSRIPNENLVFVLIDQYTASAAEDFLKMLQQMENVVVVGTNTAGCISFGNVREIYLPESKIMIRCGSKLFFELDLVSVEAIGFAPDLWCPPAEALDRVLALIENLGV